MLGVTDPAEAYFKDGIWGWDGSVWRKLPMVWGYSERYVENLAHTMTEDASHTMDFTAVSAGEIFVLQAVSWTNQSQVVRGIISIETSGTPLVYLQDKNSPGAWAYSVWLGEVVLAHNDFARVVFVSCLDTQVVEGRIWGYKMKIAE